MAWQVRALAVQTRGNKLKFSAPLSTVRQRQVDNWNSRPPAQLQVQQETLYKGKWETNKISKNS